MATLHEPTCICPTCLDDRISIPPSLRAPVSAPSLTASTDQRPETPLLMHDDLDTCRCTACIARRLAKTMARIKIVDAQLNKKAEALEVKPSENECPDAALLTEGEIHGEPLTDYPKSPPVARRINATLTVFEDGSAAAWVQQQGDEYGWGMSRGDLDGAIDFAAEKLIALADPEA